MALRVDRDHATPLKAPVGVLEEHEVGPSLAIDRDVAAYTLDQRPLDLARHEHGGIAEEMDARLGGKGGEDGERIQPVQMVGDQHIRATGRNSFAAFDADAKQRME